MDLPDLNVWFALLVADHPYHPAARAYWGAGRQAGLNRVVALGLLRLLTNPKAMDQKPLSPEEAWQVYQGLRRGGVALLEEPEGVEGVLEGLLREGFPPRLWTDAYLAAFALAGGYRLVSFDRDFSRFAPRGLHLHPLKPNL